MDDEDNKIVYKIMAGTSGALMLTLASLALPLSRDVHRGVAVGLFVVAMSLFFSGAHRVRFGVSGTDGNIKMAQYRAHALTAGDVTWWGSDPTVAARAVTLCRSDVPLLAGDVENLRKRVCGSECSRLAVNEALIGLLEKQAMAAGEVHV